MLCALVTVLLLTVPGGAGAGGLGANCGLMILPVKCPPPRPLANDTVLADLVCVLTVGEVNVVSLVLEVITGFWGWFGGCGGGPLFLMSIISFFATSGLLKRLLRLL